MWQNFTMPNFLTGRPFEYLSYLHGNPFPLLIITFAVFYGDRDIKMCHSVFETKSAETICIELLISKRK